MKHQFASCISIESIDPVLHNPLQAVELLQSREHGTFLIRYSAKNKQYALSIKCGSEVGHCLIYRYGAM